MALTKPSRLLIIGIMLVLMALTFMVSTHPALAINTSYYVDCAAGSDWNNGTSAATAWRTISKVNSSSFGAGDSVLFKRGTTCAGSLVFQSQGTSSSRITIGAYGTGALPIIDGAGFERAVKLVNPSYVTLENLEIKNSRTWGVLATTNVAGVSNGLILRNLTVHHVTGGNYVPKARKWTGLVVIAPGVVTEPTDTTNGNYRTDTHFENLLIENVTAYDTTMWAGIMIWGTQIEGSQRWATFAQDESMRSRHITIRNSTVHDTYGDGIAAFMAGNVLMEYNVVYRSGLEPAPADIGTPVALWYWAADNVLAQFNEAYENYSPGIDGGAFDFDYWSANGNYQYNYGHDNSAYCISFFGAENDITLNSIFRYNICAGNGFDTADEGAQEVYFCTWANGKIGDFQIYNNTFYITNAGLFGFCNAGGDPDFPSGYARNFRNNLVVSAIPNFMGNAFPAVPISRDYNLYYYTGGTITGADEAHSIYNQNPLVNGLGYHGVGMPSSQWTLQSGSPAINAGINPCTGVTGCNYGTRDFFGNAIPQGGTFDIGAHESGGAPVPTNTPGPSPTPVPTNTPGPSPTPAPTNTPTNTPPPTLTPTPGGSTVMHVQSTFSTTSGGTPQDVFTRPVTMGWRVQIVNQSGVAVSGASVMTTLKKPDGTVWKTYTATTDANGWALFQQNFVNNSATGVYTINVTNVTKSGATYNSGANVDAMHQFTLNP